MVVLLKYNNCAPPPEVASGEITEEDSEVRIVDRWNDHQVAFTHTKVVAHDALDSLQVHGLCAFSVEGENLQWRLEDQEGWSEIQSGQTDCDRGGFVLTATKLGDLECGVDHRIQAISRAGAADEVIVRRKCTPLASSNVMDNGPTGDSCDLELESGDQGENRCHFSCYKAGLLVSQERVELSQCPTRSAAN